MIARRILALLTMLFLLHVNVAGARIVCADHAVAASGDEDAGNDHGSHGAPAPAAPGTASNLACDVPSAPHCCGPLAGCSWTPGFEPSEHRAGGVELSFGSRIGDGVTLLTRTLGPEPPPPKA